MATHERSTPAMSTMSVVLGDVPDRGSVLRGMPRGEAAVVAGYRSGEVVEAMAMNEQVKPCRVHPPHRRDVGWDRDAVKGLSWIVSARCGRCGAELNVSRADGAYVSGPRKAGQTGPAVSGRPLDAHGNEL